MLYGTATEAARGSRALVVARVSSKEQAKDEKLSLEQQTERLRAICDKQHWEVVEEVQIGASAAKADSEYFLTMDEIMAMKKINVVLFAGVDRFCRDFMEGVNRLYQWPRKGIDIYFGEHRFDPDNPDDVCMNLVMLAFSNHKKAKNQKAALQKGEYVRLRGRVYLRDLPPGYRWAEQRTIEHDENAQLLSILWTIIDDMGLDAAVDVAAARQVALKALGVEPDSVSDVEAQFPVEKIRAKLLDLVHHPLYRGEIPYSGATYPWPNYAIGDQGTLERLRDRYPSADARPKKRGADQLDERWEPIVEAVGLTQFVSRVFRDGLVMCPECRAPKTLNGHQARGRYLLPQMKCACSTGRLIFTQSDIDRFAPCLICPQCGETDPRQLPVQAAGRDFLIRCAGCNWHTRVNRSPWAPRPGAMPPISKPEANQRQLGSYS